MAVIYQKILYSFFLEHLKYNNMYDGFISFSDINDSYLHQCDNLRADILSVNVRILKGINHLLRENGVKHQISIVCLYFKQLTNT